MKIKPLQIIAHIILILGVLLMVVPIWISFASSSHDSVTILTEGMKFHIGEHLSRNYNEVLNEKGGWSEEVTAAKMFINSFIMALGIATLKVVISAMSAYALVYYRFKLAVPIFWLIFITLLVPLEVRIFPTYSVMAKLNLVNSYFGLIVPISASAIATLFFRQFYRTVPDELLESAKLDGASTWRFFIDFLVPLSRTMIVAMLIFMFVFGYNQYLWPLLVTSSEQYWTVVMGLKMMSGSIVHRFAFVIMSMVPPILIIIILQKHFIRGVFQDK